tara:strand:+ start:1690 stop:2139 length:450 start_codon:yes stop_codon:yes gene_type:complete
MKKITIRLLIILTILSYSNSYAELTHTFKSPSFSGIGYSSHIQTIENTETSRKTIKDNERKQIILDAAQKAGNTNLVKFMNNFESRVYAQLSSQLVNNLFGENPQESGTVTIEGNTITYAKSADLLTLTVVDKDGNITEVTIPIGQLKF